MEPLSLAALVGFVGTFITAVLTRANWPSNVKRWVAIGVVGVLTVIAFVATQFPEHWETIAVALGVGVGVSQLVYTLLKPTGLFDWIQRPSDEDTSDVLH